MQYLRKKLPDEDFITYLYEIIEKNNDLNEVAVITKSNGMVQDVHRGFIFADLRQAVIIKQSNSC